MTRLNIFTAGDFINKRFWAIVLRPFFQKIGKKSGIISPLRIEGCRNIWIGDNVTIRQKCWLSAVPLTGEKICRLIIGDGSVVGGYNHIYATKSIVIGNSVLTSEKVYITDNLHRYENVGKPIISQGIRQIAEVAIGDGTWIGENASIIGVTIGRNCVVGANAVVTKNVPDFCVVAGVPAKIIRRYDQSCRHWIAVDRESAE